MLANYQVRAKAESTCLDRYGHKTGYCDATAAKRAKTNVDKHGDPIASRSEAVKAKARRTCKDRYGCEAPMQNPSVLNRSIQTNIAKLGVKYPMQNSGVRDKSEQKCLARYGVVNAGSSAMAQERSRETCLAKYGVQYPGQIPGVVDKAMATFRRNMGVDNPMQCGYTDAQLRILCDREELESVYASAGHNAITTGQIIGVSQSTILRHLRKNGSEIMKATVSVDEGHLYNYFTDELGLSVQRNRRDLIAPYEIDLYFPDANIAVEYDGLYWHTEASKGRDYHLKKTKMCQAKGIQLLHIFSSDDIELWKSVIGAKLGVFDKRIYARHTRFGEVTPKESRLFLGANHLQGAVNSSIRLGLYYEDELVSLMTFGKPRFNNAYDHELLRFCSKRGYQVIGGASKLLKNSGLRNCISYANRRWSDGQLYSSLGFEYKGETVPNYFYTKDHLTLYSRNQFQKHLLAGKLDVFDPDLSEWKNMESNGYSRVWDCGNLVYSYTK